MEEELVPEESVELPENLDTESERIYRELETHYQKKHGGEWARILREDMNRALASDEISPKTRTFCLEKVYNTMLRTELEAQLTKETSGIELPESQPKLSEIPSTAESDITFMKQYFLSEPFVRIDIVREPSGKIKYVIVEPELTELEMHYLEEIRNLVEEELDIDVSVIADKQKAISYISEKVNKIIKNYNMKISVNSIEKILYHLQRDFIGFGKIDPMMKDPFIEDISCNGPSLPLYIWHREFESIPTTAFFESARELDNFIIKLAYMTKRSVSIAQPVLDASLPDGSRLQVTYEKEVTRRGSSFTIRKFREKPFTIVDLLLSNSLSAEMAAWLWYIIENRASMMVVGGTASGKTTTVNMLSMFIKPTSKIISIEDTAELQLPHENWLPSVVRTGFSVTGKNSEINLFDLLKNAMRQRPDYIIVGEVRGSEAYTLFQAVATGHGGLATLHADSASAAVHRLESEPMNIPRPLISTLDLVISQNRVRVADKPARRIMSVSEIVGLDTQSGDILSNEVFKWNAQNDSFTFYGRSYVLERILKAKGLSLEEAQLELERRKKILSWMMDNNIRDYKDVVEVIRSYYLDASSAVDKITT